MGNALKRPALIATLRTVLVLFGAAPASQFVNAQTADAVAQAKTEKSTDVLHAIDQLIEQNRKLEQQNRELMQQINSLRQSIANQNPTAPAPAQTPPPPVQSSTVGTPADPTGSQSSSQSQSTGDDKTLLPEASGGNPAVFGEFNPGRGFIVGKGEYGELNLSGYMAARYLNQLPPNQNETDHLGRPIPIEPRNDFQFHRVMLFSQGWLFTPKFQYSTFLWTVQDT